MATKKAALLILALCVRGFALAQDEEDGGGGGGGFRARFREKIKQRVVQKLQNAPAPETIGLPKDKITTPGDMSLASVLCKEFSRGPRKTGPLGAFEEAQW